MHNRFGTNEFIPTLLVVEEYHGQLFFGRLLISLFFVMICAKLTYLIKKVNNDRGWMWTFKGRFFYGSPQGFLYDKINYERKNTLSTQFTSS